MPLHRHSIVSEALYNVHLCKAIQWSFLFMRSHLLPDKTPCRAFRWHGRCISIFSSEHQPGETHIVSAFVFFVCRTYCAKASQWMWMRWNDQCFDQVYSKEISVHNFSSLTSIPHQLARYFLSTNFRNIRNYCIISIILSYLHMKRSVTSLITQLQWTN